MSGLPLKMKRNLKSSIDVCEDDLLKRIEKKTFLTRYIPDLFVILQQTGEWQLYLDKVLVVYT